MMTARSETPTIAATPAVQAYAGKTVLITGATGFVGAALVRTLGAVDCKVRCLSRFDGTTVDGDDGPAAIETVTGPLDETDVWKGALYGADVVFHLAAHNSLAAAAADPLMDYAANVVPMACLLAAARWLGKPPTVVFSGSVRQAGPDARMPIVESQRDAPATVWDRHKLMAETYLRQAGREGWVHALALRFSNVYGRDARSGDGGGALNLMARRALAGLPLTVYGDGRYRRDYLYIDDAVQALLSAGLMPAAVSGRIFIVGSGNGTPVREAFETVAQAAASRTGRHSPIMNIVPEGPESGELRDIVCSPATFMKSSGWQAQTSLDTGIERTVDHYMRRQR